MKRTTAKKDKKRQKQSKLRALKLILLSSLLIKSTLTLKRREYYRFSDSKLSTVFIDHMDKYPSLRPIVWAYTTTATLRAISSDIPPKPEVVQIFEEDGKVGRAKYYHRIAYLSEDTMVLAFKDYDIGTRVFALGKNTKEEPYNFRIIGPKKLLKQHDKDPVFPALKTTDIPNSEDKILLISAGVIQLYRYKKKENTIVSYGDAGYHKRTKTSKTNIHNQLLMWSHDGLYIIGSTGYGDYSRSLTESGWAAAVYKVSFDESIGDGYEVATEVKFLHYVWATYRYDECNLAPHGITFKHDGTEEEKLYGGHFFYSVPGYYSVVRISRGEILNDYWHEVGIYLNGMSGIPGTTLAVVGFRTNYYSNGKTWKDDYYTSIQVLNHYAHPTSPKKDTWTGIYYRLYKKTPFGKRFGITRDLQYFFMGYWSDKDNIVMGKNLLDFC